MHKPIQKIVRKLIIPAALFITTQAAYASGFPQKPITIVVGFPPGTSTDSVARVISERVSKNIGQPVIVDNKPGVGGSLAVSHVSKAKPDGYTIVLTGTAPMNINPFVYKSITYNPLTDFAPIGQTSWLPYVLVINNQKGIKDYKSWLNYAKQNPGKLTYASIGHGTTSHLLMELLLSKAGVQMTHIPYSGSSQSQADIIGGNVDMTFDTVVSALQHTKSGRLNPLALSFNTRSPLAPDIPTVEEQGTADFNTGAWLGFFAPKDTPKEVVTKLHEEINKALNDPATNQKLVALGSEVITSPSPQEFANMVSENHTVWGNLVKQIGVEKK